LADPGRQAVRLFALGVLDAVRARLQQRHALDVRRLREHVDGPDLLEDVAGLDELGGVRRERRRVAGDVDDAARRGLDDAADDLLAEAGAWRIDDDDVRLSGFLDEVAQARADVAGVEVGGRGDLHPCPS
jgi:hypothetical protein